jgi:KDO2-lipid IV(A) lauroyltransferase
MTSPLSEHLDTAVAQINQEMERLIRECPQQYLWGYARYKQPRQES